MYLFVVKKIKESRGVNTNPLVLSGEADSPLSDNSKKSHHRISLIPDKVSLNYFDQFYFSEDSSSSSPSSSKRRPSISMPVLVLQTLKHLRRDPALESTMIKTLLHSFEYLKNLQKQIVDVEIIEDQQELQLYREIYGMSENANFRSPGDIKVLVTKTLQYFVYAKTLFDAGFFEQPDYEEDFGLADDNKDSYSSKLTKLLDLEKYFD